MSDLIEHGDGKRALELQVMNVPEPKFTTTWHPVSHAKVIHALEVAVKNEGIDVVDKNYSLAAEGQNMFGTWSLDSGERDAKIGWELGFRNSVRKSFAIGITAGTNVFVCSNLCFSGDFLEFRRHTKQVDEEELIVLAGREVGQLIEKIKYQVGWQNYLKEILLPTHRFKMLTYDAMRRGVFSPSKFNKFVDCWEEETKQEKERSLYTFHGACTRLLRDRGLFQIATQTGELNRLADDYLLEVAAYRRL